MVEITLPFPLSVNNYWRYVKFGRYTKPLISVRGRRYKDAARSMAARQTHGIITRPICEPVCVSIVFHPPDKIKRDLDNLPKALLDSITAAGIWTDDSLVHELHLKWGKKISGGKAIVRIERIAERKREDF